MISISNNYANGVSPVKLSRAVLSGHRSRARPAEFKLSQHNRSAVSLTAMKLLARDILDCIGNTSLLALRKIVPKNGARILLKIESENPTGSMKDRMALAMIEAAEADGRLKPGGTVVEYTGGSTGVSLALVCAVKGYPLHIVSSDAFSQEKLDHMRILGAELQIVRSESGGMTEKLTRDMIEAARVITKETGGFWTDQLKNTDQLAAYHKMAEEICPSPRSSPVENQALTKSTESAPVLSCRSGTERSPIRSIKFRQRKRRPWLSGSPAKKPCSPVLPPAETSSPLCDWPNNSDRTQPSLRSCATLE